MSIVETIAGAALPPSIRVRLAGPRDCEALAALLDSPAHAREQVLAWLETPGTTLLVAQSEAGVLGVAVLVTRIMPKPGGGMHKVVEVDNLVVHPDRRGQRIGRRLLASAIEESKRRNASRVVLEVRKSNAGAIRFYDEFQFQVIGERKNYYSNPIEDAYVMEHRVAV